MYICIMTRLKKHTFVHGNFRFEKKNVYEENDPTNLYVITRYNNTSVRQCIHRTLLG